MKRIIAGLIASLGALFTVAASAQTGVWNTNIAAISSRASGAAVTVGGKVYMVGGGNYSCSVYQTLQAYDPVA